MLPISYIHKEGHKILFVAGFVLWLINALLFQYLGSNSFTIAFTAFSIFIFCFMIYFFRNPKRVLDLFDNQQIIAPADGKIVVIEEVQETEYFKDKRIQVSIFMSPTNVHVNRSPVTGTVKYTKYHPGDYLVAWHPKSSTLNERYTSVLETEESDAEILVRQIAGKLARKISNYLDEGHEVAHGQEFGFIKFGSRVDIFLPVGSKINVNLKQKVKGGKTVLAELPSSFLDKGFKLFDK